jgi:hypothetical protein
MSGQTNTHITPQPPVIVAFYTTGDTRAASGTSGASVSQAFLQRAQTLATPGYIFGVATASDATAKIRAISASQPISKVYFVGHGNANVFFFDGAPVGTDNFKAVNTDGVLLNPSAVHSPMEPDSPDGTASKGLMNELASRLSLSTSPVEIAMLCCNSGINLAAALASTLSGHGINGIVGGYNNDYRTNFEGTPPKKPPKGWTSGWHDIVQTDDANKTELKRGTTNAPPSYDTSSPVTP